MYKEAIICVITVILIIVLDLITGNYTKNSVTELTNDLMELRSGMSKESIKNEETKNKIKIIYSKWDESYKRLAYYLEHDELEKVEVNLTSLNSAVETEDYAEAKRELDEMVFILHHIEEKNSFDLKNIF